MNSTEDIDVFAEHCVFVRSVYLHGRTLFETSTEIEKKRMSRAAPILFGDLNRMFVEYTILQVCKITDRAQDFRNNDNHTIAFLLRHYQSALDSIAMQRLAPLDARIQAFRQKLLPARNKLISHFDRDTVMGGTPLGGTSQNEWDQFWMDLQDVVSLIYHKVLGIPFLINKVSMLSDADALLKALKFGACFEALMDGDDAVITRKCAEMALAE